MRIHRLTREQIVPRPVDEVFGFFADARNLEALTPPLLRFRVLTPEPITLRTGAIIQYRLRVRGVPVRWTTSIQDWVPGERFVDVQLRGPYALWHHTHEFTPLGDDETRMLDVVHYAIGFGPLGEIAHRLCVQDDLDRIFEHRRQVIAERFPATSRRSPG